MSSLALSLRIIVKFMNFFFLCPVLLSANFFAFFSKLLFGFRETECHWNRVVKRLYGNCVSLVFKDGFWCCGSRKARNVAIAWWNSYHWLSHMICRNFITRKKMILHKKCENTTWFYIKIRHIRQDLSIYLLWSVKCMKVLHWMYNRMELGFSSI